MSLICANGSILADGPDASVKEGVVVAAGCRAWSCETCGLIKARELQVRLLMTLMQRVEQEATWLRQQGCDPSNAWRPFKLLTLTVDIKNFISTEQYVAKHWQAEPDEARRAIRALKHAWNRLRSWLLYRWTQTEKHRTGPRAAWERSTTFPFFWVLEFTANGWPHLHVILLWRERFSFTDIVTIRRLWEKYGIGKSVDLQNKNWSWEGPRALSGYLAKYLTKPSPTSLKGDRLRRWSASRGFLVPISKHRPEGDAGWSYAGVEAHRAEREWAGAKIHDFANGFRYSLEGQPVSNHPLAGDADSRYTYPGLSFYRRLKLSDRPIRS
jgi:hypothetical protein